MVGVTWFVAAAAWSSLALATPRIGYKGDWKSKIKNVIVLCEENRSFDTLAGGLAYNPSIDGLLHHNYCNSMNASDPAQRDDVCAGPRANDVAPDDPNHSISGVNMQRRCLARGFECHHNRCSLQHMAPR